MANIVKHTIIDIIHALGTVSKDVVTAVLPVVGKFAQDLKFEAWHTCFMFVCGAACIVCIVMTLLIFLKALVTAAVTMISKFVEFILALICFTICMYMSLEETDAGTAGENTHIRLYAGIAGSVCAIVCIMHVFPSLFSRRITSGWNSRDVGGEDSSDRKHTSARSHSPVPVTQTVSPQATLVEEPAVKESAAKEPAAKETAAKEPAAKKPAANVPASGPSFFTGLFRSNRSNSSNKNPSARSRSPVPAAKAQAAKAPAATVEQTLEQMLKEIQGLCEKDGNKARSFSTPLKTWSTANDIDEKSLRQGHIVQDRIAFLLALSKKSVLKPPPDGVRVQLLNALHKHKPEPDGPWTHWTGLELHCSDDEL